jgi:dimethylaniline monooxygenase (N-oxide forming)
MLVRTLHWVVPSYSIWGLPFFLFYSTRLAQFLYERPNQGVFRSLLCSLMKPLVRSSGVQYVSASSYIIRKCM